VVVLWCSRNSHEDDLRSNRRLRGEIKAHHCDSAVTDRQKAEGLAMFGLRQTSERERGTHWHRGCTAVRVRQAA
jgi:hypothetical protein